MCNDATFPLVGNAEQADPIMLPALSSTIRVSHFLKKWAKKAYFHIKLIFVVQIGIQKESKHIKLLVESYPLIKVAGYKF